MRVTTTSLEVAQPIIFGIFRRAPFIFSSRDNNERIISLERKKERKKGKERGKKKKTEFSARDRTNQNWFNLITETQI